MRDGPETISSRVPLLRAEADKHKAGVPHLIGPGSDRASENAARSHAPPTKRSCDPSHDDALPCLRVPVECSYPYASATLSPDTWISRPGSTSPRNPRWCGDADTTCPCM